MKIVTIVGARPQFIKYFPVSKAMNKLKGKGITIDDVLVHTGQHYDYDMSKVFFDELGIPEPNYNLGVGPGIHGAQTGQMLVMIEEVLLHEKPDCVVVYGDTNSTLAGSLATSKLHIPVAHVEAGLRSFNREMPEEINRVLTDHLPNILFCPTETSVQNLAAEGINNGVHMVGDVMFDAFSHFFVIAKKTSDILRRLRVEPSNYFLLTLHRPSNTDNADSLKQIFSALQEMKEFTFVFTCHPRSRRVIELYGFSVPTNVIIIDPVSYLDMLILEKNTKKILTDSGGVQKEAYWQGVPCITLRDETEWVETVEAGWNILVGTKPDQIVRAVKEFEPQSHASLFFGNRNVAERIIELLLKIKPEMR